jgi:hypothetical protein
LAREGYPYGSVAVYDVITGGEKNSALGGGIEIEISVGNPQPW